MKNITLISIVLLLTACANAPKNMSNTDGNCDHCICSKTTAGLSMNEAVVLPNGANDIDSVSAEYAWIRENMPSCIIKSQAFLNKNGKVYRLITVTSAEHKDRPVYFDITNFYGKVSK